MASTALDLCIVEPTHGWFKSSRQKSQKPKPTQVTPKRAKALLEAMYVAALKEFQDFVIHKLPYEDAFEERRDGEKRQQLLDAVRQAENKLVKGFPHVNLKALRLQNKINQLEHFSTRDV
tara:strand:- start:26 stop:385 length:360 start_codon:yes stop_codon:yes gene_type:complete